MRRNVLIITVCLFLAVILTSCSRSHKAIQIKGSDTMVNLSQVWAEEFMKLYPESAVAVTGGGSGTGVAALINQTTDIAMTSRDMSKKEIEEARKLEIEPREIPVALDGIAVIVAKNNPVNQLTLEELSEIFAGGGRLVALSRDRNSGTHAFFLEKVVKLGDKRSPKEFGPQVLMMPSNQAIVEEVAGNSSAIGYIGLGYVTKQVKVVAVAKKTGDKFILPSAASVKSGEYPIARALNFYTNGEPSGEVKVFIDFVLGPAGQKVVREMDFVPIR